MLLIARRLDAWMVEEDVHERVFSAAGKMHGDLQKSAKVGQGHHPRALALCRLQHRLVHREGGERGHCGTLGILESWTGRRVGRGMRRENQKPLTGSVSNRLLASPYAVF